MQYFKPTKYIKDESFDPIYSHVNKRFFTRTRILPSSLLALGLVLLVSQVLMPLVFFKTQDEVFTPAYSTALGRASGFSDFEFSELNSKSRVLGITTETNGQDEKYFYLSIPKLNIENAKVEINEPTLKPDKALGHYTGSSLPGEVGNSFIYGHSVLPIFYNPKNYKTIFSTLYKLEPGDLIYAIYKGKKYTYKVEGQRELVPELVDPLALIKPKFLNESTMVLMTCSPEGTKLRRRMIDSVLVETVDL